MPRIDIITGAIWCGIGGNEVSVMPFDGPARVVAPTNAGGACVLRSGIGFFQIGASLYACSEDPFGTPTLFDPLGANELAAGGGVYAAKFDDVVRVSNTTDTYPKHGVGDVGSDGTVLLYSPDGTYAGRIIKAIQSCGVGQWSGTDANDRPTSSGMTPIDAPSGPIYGLRRFGDVCCYQSGTRFIVSKIQGRKGRVYDNNPEVNRPDIVILPNGRIRAAFSVGKEERLHEIVVKDLSMSDLTEDIPDVTDPIVPADRPMWTGFYAGGPKPGGGWTTTDSPHTLPGNCYLAVQEGVVRSMDGDRFAMSYVSTDDPAIGKDIDALEAAAQKVPNPLAYWDDRRWPRWPALPPTGRACLRAYPLRDESHDAFEADIKAVAATAPAGLRLVLVAYCASNPTLAQDVAALVPIYSRLRRDCHNFDGVIVFNGNGHKGGMQDHPEARPAWDEFCRTVPGHPPIEQEPDVKPPQITMTNPVPKVTKDGFKLEIRDPTNGQLVTVFTKDGSWWGTWDITGHPPQAATGARRPVVLDCPTGPTVPSAPTGLRATGTPTAVNLSWSDVATNESSQRIERCKGLDCVGFETIATVAANVTTYTDRNVATDSIYRYRVFAINEFGASPSSNIASATTAGTPVTDFFTLRRSDRVEKVGVDSNRFLTQKGRVVGFQMKDGGMLTNDGKFVAVEPPSWIGKADRDVVDSDWQRIDEERNSDGSFSYKSRNSKKYMSLHDDFTVRFDAAEKGGLERFVKEAYSGGGTAVRPLQGALRQIGKVFGDDTGYRRVLFYSWFPAPRIMVDDFGAFTSGLDLIAQYYQGIRVFISVGGYESYWGGREVAIVRFTNDLGHVIEINFTHDDWRTFLRECRKRNLRLHVTTGDGGIIFRNNPSLEVETMRTFARIAQEEGGWQIIAVWEAHNEYPIADNSLYGDSPQEDEQDQRILDAVRAELPGVLTMRGSINSEEPDALERGSRCGPICAIHQTRQPPATAVKHTFGLEHWEGNPKSFPKPFWFGEPGGWNEPDPRNDVYAPMPTKDWTVALYAMMTCTGYAVNYFDGISVRARAPIGSMEWGFAEMPAILARVPEDVGSWGGSNGPGGAIWYWHSGDRFASATIEGWNASPPRRVKTWAIVGADSTLEGEGHDAYMNALASLGSSFGGRLLVGTFEPQGLMERTAAAIANTFRSIFIRD